ncbi:MAG: HlyD family efflux transporter periplasmic adaptor subunit [Planctomycetales bacterium]|nr:HlyD family efflux transporter periplasmic adaptor subunit [Planctomycetales bacterium]
MTNRQRLAADKSSRRGNSLLIIIIILGLLGGGALAWYQFGSGGGKAKTRELVTDVAFVGPFDHVVLEQGEVESSKNIDVICEVKAGRSSGASSGTPILWVIDEGSIVEEGDKLVELDSSSLENELGTQKIAVASAEATVISSKATVKTAEISLMEYIQGTYEQERKAIISEIAVAEQELRKAELSLSSAERMGAKGMVRALQIEAEQYAVDNARNVLEAAQSKLKVLEELTLEKNKVQFESDIEAAKAKLASDESVLAEELEDLREIEDQIKKCVILSPASGVVVHNNSFSSRGGSAEFVVEEGASVRERQTIIKLPDPSKMQVKAKVNESRVTLIGVGMAAKVKVGAAEGEMLARVTRVNKYAEPGNFFNSSVKEYATIIEILDPPETIRTGMTAEVRIFVEQLENALQIPVHGLYEHKGRHFCLVRDGENWKTVEVKIGATNDKTVTIREGIAEGDEVVLNPRQHLDMMEFPEIDEVSDREQLAAIGANAQAPQAPADQGSEGPAGEGGGGGGGFDPAAIADRIFSNADTDGDGKISAEELSANGNLSTRAADWDADKNGELTKEEVINGMKKSGGRGGRGGGGGQGGFGGRGGPGGGGGRAGGGEGRGGF